MKNYLIIGNGIAAAGCIGRVFGHGRPPAPPDKTIAVPDFFDEHFDFVGKCFVFILRERDDEIIGFARLGIQVMRTEKYTAPSSVA